jgi:putative heme iron utilization protein
VDGAFAIAVSGLAAHTRHLQARPEASVLLVGPGTDDGDAFARPRLMVAVRARYVERGSATSGDLWAALARRHGETVETLRGLPDFATLRLEPTSGRAIFGFAAASDLDAATLRDVLRTAS